MTAIDNIKNMMTIIQQKKPDFRPKIGIILGSGSGELAEEIQSPVVIPYAEIPGFPQSTVAGHKGQMLLGLLSHVPVVCMQGRIHAYEGADNNAFKIFIRLLKRLGTEILIMTNASGSLREDIGAGELSLISDHINLQHAIPLIGPNDDDFGPRFFAMTNAYDAKLRERFQKIALKLQIRLAEGVYVGVTGPCYETPAEIRAFRLLGADLVGMSTVPEVIIARHCGLRVAAIAAITNPAAGMDNKDITHEDTLYYSQICTKNLSRLIKGVLESFHHDPQGL
jgi:xanthosine phosphorylase